MKKDIATECYCVVASDDKDKCLPRKTLKETRLKPTDINLTFLLGEREAGNTLAHGHEGEVVLHHRLVELALKPTEGSEPRHVNNQSTVNITKLWEKYVQNSNLSQTKRASLELYSTP